MNRIVMVAGVAAAQLVLVGVALGPQMITHLTGETVRVAAETNTFTYDGNEPSDGLYLQYPALDRWLPSFESPTHDAKDEPDEVTDLEGRVYVPLTQEGDLWTFGAASKQRPAEGLHLTCEAQWYEIDCGINHAKVTTEQWDEFPADSVDVIVELKVSSFGTAVVTGVEPR